MSCTQRLSSGRISKRIFTLVKSGETVSRSHVLRILEAAVGRTTLDDLESFLGLQKAFSRASPIKETAIAAVR